MQDAKEKSRKELAELVAAAQAGDAGAANRLAEAMTPYVRHRARAMRMPIPLEDLVQEGLLGVLESLKRFNLGRGFRFETFAQFRIDGRMRDYCRRHGYFLTGGYRSGRVEIMERLRRKIQIGPRAGELEDLDPRDERQDETEQLLNLDAFKEATRSCLAWHRVILRLRFVDDMALKDIANLLGLAESRVSQIITQETKRLATILGPGRNVSSARPGPPRGCQSSPS